MERLKLCVSSGICRDEEAVKASEMTKLEAFCQEYCQTVQQLPGVCSVEFTGSVANGNFVPGRSDIDVGFYHIESVGITSATENTTTEAYVSWGTPRMVAGEGGVSRPDGGGIFQDTPRGFRCRSKLAVPY